MKSWRESASIIMAARNGLKFISKKSYDYDLLFLKRKKTGTFPGAYVFPGGVIETADADLKWHNLYKNHGYNENSFKTLLSSTNNTPLIFQSRENELPREISLRISAIRETFEECGVLLCQKSSEISNIAHPFPISSNDLEFWQKKVHHDPNEFYNMCNELHCCPNLWALHMWANWLTPTFFPPAKRFNAAFFFTCLPEIPSTKLDLDEMEDLVWATPEYVKESLINFLYHPQQYEMDKIANYKKLDSLFEHVLSNSKREVQLYLPVKVKLSDGEVFLFPGDCKYPKNVNLHEKEILDETKLTIQQFREISDITHRFEFPSKPGDSKTTHLTLSKL